MAAGGKQRRGRAGGTLAGVGVALLAACATDIDAEQLSDQISLYYPTLVADAAAGAGTAAFVVSTDFDHRFGRGWVSRFDLDAWVAQSGPALTRLVEVPSLGSRLIANLGAASARPRQWYLSHRGVGVVTVLDASGSPPTLSCGQPAAGADPLPAALALSGCDRAHLVDLAQGLRDGEAPPPPSRALFDVAGLAFSPQEAVPAWAHDRLWVGTLGRADVVRGVSGRLLALDLLYGDGGGQAQVRPEVVDVGSGIGAMLPVVADQPTGANGAGAGPQPAVQVIASGFPVARQAGHLAPDPASLGLRLGGLEPQGGLLARLSVDANGAAPPAPARDPIALTTPLGGLEMVGLLADPHDPTRLLGLSRGPDALFDLRLLPDVRATGGTPTAGTRWGQGSLLVPLPGRQPQAFTAFASQAYGASVVAVAGAGDDSLTLLDAGAGAVLARIDLATKAAPQGAAPAGVAYLRPASPIPWPQGNLSGQLEEVLVVSLFFSHALAIIDVSAPDPAAWSQVGLVASPAPPAARRFL